MRTSPDAPARRAVAGDLDEPTWTRSGSGLIVPNRLPGRRRYERPVGVDLFCGAGGFSLGFHQAGFHVAAAMEWDVTAAMTYMINLANPGVRIHFDGPEREQAFTKAAEKMLGSKGKAAAAGVDEREARRLYAELWRTGRTAGSGWIAGYGRQHRAEDYANEYVASLNEPPAHQDGCEHFWVADIRTVSGQDILDALGLDAGDVDAVFGGPPCQGFSRSGKRDVMDPRNSLVFEFARLVLELRPKTFVMENVTGMLSMVTEDGVPVVDAFARVIADGGFAAYDALRRSLRSHPAARAGMRGESPGGPADEAEFDEDPGDIAVQGALFAEAGA